MYSEGCGATSEVHGPSVFCKTWDASQVMAVEPWPYTGTVSVPGCLKLQPQPRGAYRYGPKGSSQSLHLCKVHVSCAFCLFLVTQGPAHLQENAAGGGSGARDEGQSDGEGDASGQ